MNLSETAQAINAELKRLGVDYHSQDNSEGLVCRAEPGRKPLAVRMGNEWFTAVYAAEGLLYFLRYLRVEPKAHFAYWDSGSFWKELRENNLELIDHAPAGATPGPASSPAVIEREGNDE